MAGPGLLNQILGGIIRRERERLGLSQAAAARASGRTQRWQTKTEQGGCYIRVEDLEAMRAWGLDVHAALAEARLKERECSEAGAA